MSSNPDAVKVHGWWYQIPWASVGWTDIMSDDPCAEVAEAGGKLVERVGCAAGNIPFTSQYSQFAALVASVVPMTLVTVDVTAMAEAGLPA